MRKFSTHYQIDRVAHIIKAEGEIDTLRLVRATGWSNHTLDKLRPLLKMVYPQVHYSKQFYTWIETHTDSEDASKDEGKQ